MDDIDVMRSLADSLEQAAAHQDWSRLQQVDAQIASLLISLKGQSMDTEKREALQQLRAVHQRVNQYCQHKRDELETEMARTRNNQQGAMAYAQFSDAKD
ncbi:flagellar protein FliT [Pantoea allii]|uniref:flagellar protein FliT n=1 Tax=Pantoea TaxID=53335 RepID=UPI0007C7E887|nr:MULTISPECIES: flagellar protein FliT [Pantoea]MBW1252899.1 flagellar protein FliT [Pantoea allii]MBW1262323.1 flagellar protein FliT [Pantoea allii]MBW1283452.1 flagellar protein FliT [Pantoea allii]OAE08584.1 hypothetical protein A6A26_13630 [Pantoea sp. OXWO6B1]ORM87254.1 hypothetical protein HA38_06035 [Pantoea allii]